MMKKTLSVATLLAAGLSHAAGFAVDTHSARAVGLGMTVNATIEDSTAIAYNPASILGVEKLDIAAGVVVANPRVRLTPEGGQEQGFKTTLAPPPHAFIVHRINDSMAAGIGLYVPFGAGANWQDDFVGRNRGFESSLATYYINPTFAYQAHERFRVGVGVSLIRGVVDIKRRLFLPEGEGGVHIGGDSWDFGYNAGIHIQLVEKVLSFGAQFRSPSKMTFTGNADFQEIPPEFQGRLKDQGVKATVTMPANVGLGVAVTPIERLTIGFDANLVQWSSIEYFTIEFEDDSLTNPLPKLWKDTWNFHLSGEYGLTKAIILRTGLIYDPTPSPEETLTPDLPAVDRLRGSIGLGFAFDPIRVDLGYQGAIVLNTKSTAPGIAGTYGGVFHNFALTVGYTLK